MRRTCVLFAVLLPLACAGKREASQSPEGGAVTPSDQSPTQSTSDSFLKLPSAEGSSGDSPTSGTPEKTGGQGCRIEAEAGTLSGSSWRMVWSAKGEVVGSLAPRSDAHAGDRLTLLLPEGTLTPGRDFQYEGQALSLRGTLWGAAVFLPKPLWIGDVLLLESDTPVLPRSVQGGQVELMARAGLSEAKLADGLSLLVPCVGLGLAPAAYDAWQVALAVPQAGGAELESSRWSRGVLRGGGPLEVSAEPEGEVRLRLTPAGDAKVGRSEDPDEPDAGRLLLGEERAGKRFFLWDLGRAVLRGWADTSRFSEFRPEDSVKIGRGVMSSSTRYRKPIGRESICSKPVDLHLLHRTVQMLHEKPKNKSPDDVGELARVGQIKAGAVFILSEKERRKDGMLRAYLIDAPVSLTNLNHWLVPAEQVVDCKAQ